MKIDRFDMNGERLKVGNIVRNKYTGEEFTVVFAKDILAFGIEDKNGHFEFMTDWVDLDWEVVA